MRVLSDAADAFRFLTRLPVPGRLDPAPGAG